MDCRIHAYGLMNDQKSHGYELMDGQKSHACELRRCKRRADERVLVSECGKMVELKSLTKVKEIACVKMQT